jgi:hypothetical protein
VPLLGVEVALPKSATLSGDLGPGAGLGGLGGGGGGRPLRPITPRAGVGGAGAAAVALALEVEPIPLRVEETPLAQPIAPPPSPPAVPAVHFDHRGLTVYAPYRIHSRGLT